jgi:transposase
MSEPILEQLLGLPHLTISRYELPDAKSVILDIQPAWRVALCPECGHPSADLHDCDDPRLIRDLSLWGRHCFLRLRSAL